MYPLIASGLVDNLILWINPLSLYSLATAKSYFCFATGIAVKVPPKNDTSIMEFLVSIVSK